MHRDLAVIGAPHIAGVRVGASRQHVDEALIGELHSSWAGEQTSEQAYDKIAKAWKTIQEETK